MGFRLGGKNASYQDLSQFSAVAELTMTGVRYGSEAEKAREACE